MISFAYPSAFFLLLLPFIIYYILPEARGVHGDALRITFLQDLNRINILSGGLWQQSSSSSKFFSSLSRFILLTTYLLLITAIARPQIVGEPIRLKNEGRDILMIMDISNSMLEPDFSVKGHRTSRLNVVKAVASDFIDKRIDDRFGLVLFGSRAYLQSPLTYDKQSVKDILFSMDAGMAGNSTAIGDALGLSLKTLKDAPNKDNKIIILLTDGENNDGNLSLPQALNLAKNENIKIYTIGVGGAGSLAQSILGYKIAMPSGLDEKGLQKIANETQGQYFRASDTSSLLEIYDAIDKLEPQSNEENYVQEIKEYYYIPLALAIIFSILLLFIKRRG